jgi:hypothetical protein
MENPYATPSHQAETKPRRSRVAEAQEFPALRRFHYFMLLVGLISLIGAGAIYANAESAGGRVSRAASVRNRAERTALADKVEVAQVRSAVVQAILGSILFICAFTAFHYPLASTVIASLIYLLTTLSMIFVFVSEGEVMGIGPVGIRILIQIILFFAVQTAYRFQQDFEYREYKARSAVDS